MTNTATEMSLTATEGNFEFHSAGKIEMTGEKNGIVYGDYKPMHKEDRISNGINVNLNIFFDGTGNNKTNTEARDKKSLKHKEYEAIEPRKRDSFENGETNVARSFDAINPSAENQVAVYIEGMGTEDLKEDTKFPGVALGMGDTGIEAKVTKGCMDAGNMMAKKGYSGKEIDYLFVNVYGFSRGAAAARHFIHVGTKMVGRSDAQLSDGKTSKYYIHSDYRFGNKKQTEIYHFPLIIENTAFIDKYGYFGACLIKNEVKPKFIVYNFVGLYDCVASFGLFHDNNTSELKLNSITKAKFVYHIASDDEYRKNFPLTNIKSCGLRGIEFILPGVHSDIGGSYLDNVEEISVIENYQCGTTDDAKNSAEYNKDKDFEKFKKIVVDEGWFDKKQLTKEFFYEEKFDPLTRWYENQHNYGLVGRRILSNSYDKIPLHLMIEQSKGYNVKYLQSKLESFAIKNEFIKQVQNSLGHYINGCVNKHNEYVNIYNSVLQNFEDLSNGYNNEIKKIHYQNFIAIEDLKKLRKNFLHWSTKDNLFGLSPTKQGDVVQALRKRHTYDG